MLQTGPYSYLSGRVGARCEGRVRGHAEYWRLQVRGNMARGGSGGLRDRGLQRWK